MRKLTKDEIGILQRHAKWLRGEEGGERANLRGANLQGANLQGANLQGADLRGANLRSADLRSANLQGADLQGADLQGADLQGADIQGADLQDADLRSADLAFCCWPLWCGSINAKADDRLFAQLLFHVTRLDVSACSGGVREAMEHLRSLAVSDLFYEFRGDITRLEA